MRNKEKYALFCKKFYYFIRTYLLETEHYLY